MDNNKRFSQIEELLAEVMRKQDQQKEILNRHTQILEKHSSQFESMERTFNTGFNAMLKKMDDFIGEVKGLRGDFQKFAVTRKELERLKKLSLGKRPD